MRPALVFFILIIGCAAACASAPQPKAPDESHRVPVNRTVPAEAAAGRGPEAQPRRKGRDGEAVWR
jgi:hypothetical protein